MNTFLNANTALKEGRVILLSDGQSTCGEIRPPGVYSRRTDYLVSKPRASRVRFFTIGFDITPGSTAERDLQYLASETGGRYYNASDREQLMSSLRKQVRRYIPRSCNTSSPDFAMGLNAFAEYDYVSAMRAFQRYNAANPSDWCGFYNLALACEASGRYRNAGDGYRKYLDIAPNSPDRMKIEAKIAEMRDEYVAQLDYFVRLIASDRDYLKAFYQSIFNRTSSDLAVEFDGFVFEKQDFYANLPDILEIDARWLSNDAKDISSSLDVLRKRRNLPTFDRDSVSLLTTPVGQIEDLLGRLHQYKGTFR